MGAAAAELMKAFRTSNGARFVILLAALVASLHSPSDLGLAVALGVLFLNWCATTILAATSAIATEARANAERDTARLRLLIESRETKAMREHWDWEAIDARTLEMLPQAKAEETAAAKPALAIAGAVLSDVMTLAVAYGISRLF